MQTNDAGVALIKSFEGLRLKAYHDSVGVLTIGFGHTSAAGAPLVTKGLTITDDEAEQILRTDLLLYEDVVEEAVTVPLTGNQFAALVSFTYNLGGGNLRSSTLLRKLNAGDYAGAADEFARWDKAGGKVLAGLTRRRAAERELFLTPDTGQGVDPNTPLTFGSLDPRNRQIQTILAGLGLYTRRIDDQWGQGQQDALDALAARITLIKGAG